MVNKRGNGDIIMRKNLYVNQLPVAIQEEIRGELEHHLFYEFMLTGEEREKVVKDGMNSRLSDLEEVIDIQELGR